MADVEYWPFEVPSSEKWSEHDRHFFSLLDTALARGFKPYCVWRRDCGASSPNGREGELIHRGADRYWEVRLGGPDQTVSPFFVDGFPYAAEALVAWLSGVELQRILEPLQSRVVRWPGANGWAKTATATTATLASSTSDRS